MPLLVWLSFAEFRGRIGKVKGLWEWPLKVSGPLDHFRIEGQNFTDFWLISQLFIGFGKKSLIIPTEDLFYTQSL